MVVGAVVVVGAGSADGTAGAGRRAAMFGGPPFRFFGLRFFGLLRLMLVVLGGSSGAAEQKRRLDHG
ncbi:MULTISPECIES: hypothetical protein [Rhodopseudomonas]|uniref:Uncharacterized protein n=1 Tax=Rhodopseudomonas palustris TaxID=1076 RepID=A0A0D7EDR7_RHOPL|nr:MULTISPECIES: hypothetical protein [Rhodopseudomonas]KIZ38670.1 hypothetical protein OO17_22615 [Rhodopseudomonas palustris]MDF3809493.1 hypothetical protein [Rhodopseudomonas sp. BAL398]WOK19367.1 hypothetical protein RBJ75_07580 [Rhodopseudomonas sp. BAL398]